MKKEPARKYSPQADARPEPARVKKAYARPQLTRFGSVEKLTQTGGSTTRDGGGGRRRH